MGYFIGVFVKSYQARYGEKARPDLRGRVQGQIKRLLADLPLGRACELIQVYCQMNDAWFLTKAHDFGTFYENVGKVSLALDTGRYTTQAEARAADQSQANLSGWADLHREAKAREAGHG